MESPSHPSYGRHSRNSSSSRFSGIFRSSSGRKRGKKSNEGWPECNVIVEEGDYDDGDGLTRRSQALIALLGFIVLFAVFCLIIWGAARPFKAEVTVKVDAVHFTYEVGLVDGFPPVPLLKAFLKDAKKAATSILEDPNNSGRAALAARKEQSALRAVVKCIEEYKLEAEFPSESLKKRLEQLEKVKTKKKRPAAIPANKRTRTSKLNYM